MLGIVFVKVSLFQQFFMSDHGDLEGSLGLECAGVVTALGDGVSHLHLGQSVVAVARGCLGSYAVTDAHLACAKPVGLSFEEAASIPIIFLTAHYALHEHARLERDGRDLAHAPLHA